MKRVFLFILSLVGLLTVFPHSVEKHEKRLVSGRELLQRYFPSSSLFLVMDSARHAGKVDEAYAELRTGEGIPFSGQGVIVGVVDLGYDLSHPAFFSPEGEFRIKRLWDQNRRAGNSPERYPYGAEYTTPEEILAIERDSVEASHGTHVTNIAAGSDTGSPYYGVARGADLVLVSTSLKDQEVLDGVKYIADYARQEGKPCVINLSIGGRIGPHDGTSFFDRALDSIVSRGLLVVGASGNDGYIGSDGFHSSRIFTSLADTLYLQNRSAKGICYADIWGEVGNEFNVIATLTDTVTGEILFSHTEWIDTNKETCWADSVTFGKNAFAGIWAVRDSVNNRPHAAVVCSIPNRGDRLRFDTRIISKPGQIVHAWAAENSKFLCGRGTSVNNSSTMMEVGGTGHSTLTVGAFVTKNRTPTKVTEFKLYEINPGSSRGPTLDGRMKPDVTATGSLVVSAISHFDPTFLSLSIDTVSRGGIDYYYAPGQGTSMAAPFVTGVVALWLQANPELSVDEVREIMKETSWKDVRVDMSDPSTWGTGKVDAYAGLKYVLKNYPVSVQTPDVLQREVEFFSGENARLLFLWEVREVRVSGYLPSGELLFSEFYPFVGGGEEVILPSTASSGVILLRITTATQTNTFRMIR